MCLQVSGEMSQAIRTAYAKAPRQKCAAMLDEGQAAGVAERRGRDLNLSFYRFQKTK